MCGIAGIISRTNDDLVFERIKKAGNAIKHRGPDAEGIYRHENVTLLHRRLSIIDLSEAANQPMQSACGKYVIIFNGEIFNYKELSNTLNVHGYRLKTNSDTEVLLYLLMHYGTDALMMLNGFFAFAFYDIANQKLLLARDRMGVKPLFFNSTQHAFNFASEPKALFAMGVPKEINDAALQETFFYRFTAGSHTVFNDVYRLLPGHYIELNTQTLFYSTKRWFHLGQEAQKHSRIHEPLAWFENTFHQAVKYRMIADVKVGTMLSGGLDSSSVLYSQYIQQYKDVTTWTIGFNNFKDDESDLASKLSREYGFGSNIYQFDDQNLVNLLNEAIHYHDEPLIHWQEPHILGLAKYAKQAVTVLLSGEGSDELLAGYVRHKTHDKRLRYHLLQILQYIPEKWLKQPRLKKLKSYLSVANEPFQLMCNANNLFLSDLEKLNIYGFNFIAEHRINVLKEAEEIYPDNKLRQLIYMDQLLYIPSLNDRNDRTTMGASIECREPFMDANLVTGLASLDNKWFDTTGKGKKLLMKTIGKHLPDYIQHHRKIGLSVPWIHHINNIPELKSHLEIMHSSDLFQLPLFNQLNVKSILRQYKNGNQQLQPLVLTLYMLTYWYKIQFAKC